MKRNIKIGFSDIGGIYIGKEIQTEKHLFHAITIAISFSEKFEYWCEQQKVYCTGVVMQANTTRKFINPSNSYIAFIHIEPFSKQGFELTNKSEPFKELTLVQIKKITTLLKNWFSNEVNNEDLTTKLIDEVTSQIGYSSTITIDDRIIKAIEKIRKSEDITLKQISENSHLSAYRFSHLFKQQTGISFREFVLYTKLVKSLKAVYQNQNLTHSSYSGGFSDQAHFTRTYYKAFGILPSQSVK